ncbi:MAG: glycosyltransferase family 2 protein, partial [Alphaproteobacteria bacterium]|nr:glycosyltransferase family 2 protein [Alphaproteobacteria bacterium]
MSNNYGMRPPVKNQQARHSNQRAATKSSPSTPPLVSVIIPCYQAEQYITTAVQSIWAQVNLGQPIEIIAVDDGSTDGTARLLHHLKVQSTIPFFIITHPTNRGVASARQSGVAAARGQFILWQDADDQAHPKRLAMLLAGWYQHEKKLSSPSSANNNPTKLAAIGSGFYIVAGQKIKHGKTPTAFIDANYLPHYLTHHGKAVATDITNYHCQPLAIHFPTLLVRRSLYDQFAYRPWPLAEDHDWLYRLLESGLTVINLPKRLYYYRKHGASLTRRHADKLILGAMVRLSSLCRSLHLPEPLFPLPRGGLSHRSSG